jgi:hypothetical protein
METVRQGDADRWRDLVHQVREIRRLQKAGCSDQWNLMAERAVDQLLESFDAAGNPRPIQSTLFDTEDA